jgi:hypothetical protein
METEMPYNGNKAKGTIYTPICGLSGGNKGKGYQAVKNTEDMEYI